MNFKIKSVEDAIYAINKLIELNQNSITCKKVKEILNIKSNNRSKTNFIWRILSDLEKLGVLQANGSNSVKSYKIKGKNLLDKEKIIANFRNIEITD